MNAVIDVIRCESTAQIVLDTPLGALRLVRTPRGLAGAWFEGQKHHPGAIGAAERPDDALLMRAARQLRAYFESDATTAFDDLPLDLNGTPFQRRVWQALQRIPRGGTCSYAQVAASIGAPLAVRAVGAAVGRNPLSVIVPCHRVVGLDGSLTGYAGGLDRKRWLLAREHRDAPHVAAARA
jgi:methylated-DNA-[protein]-cysteine S-methyltransferase